MKPQNETLKKVWTIVKTWWLIATFLLICVGIGRNGMIVGFALLSVLATLEYFKHSRLQDLKVTLTSIVFLFVIGQYVALYFEKYLIFHILPVLMVILFLPPVVIFGDGIKRIPSIFTSLIGPIIVLHFLACLTALYLIVEKAEWGGTSQAIKTIFTLILLTEGNDVLQFLCGKSFGKRKITPEISPNKTEAGFVGGLVLTTLLGSYLFNLVLNFGYAESALMGFLISLYGIQGDLFFSIVKRFFGVKDFSDALPGHGGYLDRLDSLILTAPVILYFIAFAKGAF
jgi:phosphatidate cytidylyltransferase